MFTGQGLVAAAGAASVMALASCGGGGAEEGPPRSRARITIEIPSTDSFSTTSSAAFLSGVAFNSNLFTSCSFFTPEDGGDGTGVTVTWSNSTGGSGTASQSKNCCGFGVNGFLCDHHNEVGSHNWSVSVPIAVGANVVTVRASDASGNSATDTVTISR
jgi:hypothetical protein